MDEWTHTGFCSKESKKLKKLGGNTFLAWNVL
jgi:hypothetical protein